MVQPRSFRFSFIVGIFLLAFLAAASDRPAPATNSALEDLLKFERAGKPTNWSDLKEPLQKAVELYPKNPKLQLGLADCFFHEKDFRSAREHYKIVTNLAPGDLKALSRLAASEYNLGMFHEAAEAYNRCTVLNPGESNAWYWLGASWQKAGNTNEAKRALETELTFKAEDSAGHRLRGMALSRLRRWPEALKEFQCCLNKNPDDIYTNLNATFSLAHSYYRTKKFDDAAKAYQQCTRLASTNFDAWFWYGRSLHAAGSNDLAVGAFTSVLKIKPDSADGHYWLGVALYWLERDLEAADALRFSVHAKPNDFYAHYWYGLVLYRLKRYQEAIDELQFSAHAEPEEFYSHYWLGNALNGAHRYAEAIAPFQVALKGKPDESDANYRFDTHYYLGIAFYWTKQYQNAAEAFQAAVKERPEDSHFHYWLGYDFEQLHRYEDAVKEFKEAVRIKPSNFDAHFELGFSLVKLRRFPEAVPEYEAAHQLKPENRDAKTQLLTTLLLTSQYQKAARLFPALFALAAGGVGISYACGLLIWLWRSFKKGAATAPGLMFFLGWLFLFVEGQAASILLIGCFLPAYKMAVMVNASLLGCALPIAFAAFVGFPRQPWGEPFARTLRMPALKTIGFCLLATFGAVLFNACFEQAYTWLTGNPPPDQAIAPDLKNAFADAPWLTTVAAGLLAPVCEEILFRGLLYGALLKWMKPGWVIVLTAAIFSLMHLQPFYFLPLFVIGLLLGWARHKTGSLTAPMLIHCLNNLAAVVALHFK